MQAQLSQPVLRQILRATAAVAVASTLAIGLGACAANDPLADQFKAKGVDAIYCLSVNDAFVMKAWQVAQNADAITMLADGDGSWTRALGLAKETGAFGGLRAQRFALIARDGVVQQLFVEAPGKFEVSDAQSLLAAL